MRTLSEHAELLARTAHQGQVDKAGRAYITHPERVAARVRGDQEAEAAAWLHDVVEDTGYGLDDLRAKGFPESVVLAVDAVTKRAGESKDAYYARVASNPLAVKVKLADLDDNSDPARLALLDEATRERLIAKYEYARARLTSRV